MSFTEKMLASVGIVRSGGLKSVVVGATIAWATSAAQRMAAEAAEVTLEAETRYAKAVEALEFVQQQRSEIVADQIGDGMYDNAVASRALSLGWTPRDTAESFEDFAARVAPVNVVPSDVDGEAMAECGQPWPCEHAPDGGNHPMVAH